MNRETIFKEFYSIIKSNTSAKVTNSLVYEDDKVPQIVVNPPQLPKLRECFGQESRAYNRDGELEIGLYANSVKDVVQLVDDVEDIIFDNLDVFTVTNINAGSSTIADIPLKSKVVKGYILPISFQFRAGEDEIVSS